jgi:L-rhamnonate dehydratase
MKITSIRCIDLEIPRHGHEDAASHPDIRAEPWTRRRWAGPLDRYPTAAYRTATPPPKKHLFGVVVEVEDGTWGFGLGHQGRAAAALVEDVLAPGLEGENVMAHEALYDMAVRHCAAIGAGGLAAFAISAVDVAVWDVKGKLLDRPVYELIGGPAKDDLELYATGADVEWYFEQGFRSIKLPRPYGPADGLDGIQGTVAFVAEAREKVGDGVELMLDCWQTYDVDYTVRLAEALRPYRLRWIEEALPPDAFDAHEQLRRRVPWQTFATGEHWFGTPTFQYAAAHHLVDVFQPDVNWVGGLTPVLKIAAIAESAGIELALHAGALTPYGQHASLGLPAISMTEHFVATAPGLIPIRGPWSLPGQGVADGARLTVPSAPGFGITLDPTTFRPFAF